MPVGITNYEVELYWIPCITHLEGSTLLAGCWHVPISTGSALAAFTTVQHAVVTVCSLPSQPPQPLLWLQLMLWECRLLLLLVVRRILLLLVLRLLRSGCKRRLLCILLLAVLHLTVLVLQRLLRGLLLLCAVLHVRVDRRGSCSRTALAFQANQILCHLDLLRCARDGNCP